MSYLEYLCLTKFGGSLMKRPAASDNGTVTSFPFSDNRN